MVGSEFHDNEKAVISEPLGKGKKKETLISTSKIGVGRR